MQRYVGLNAENRIVSTTDLNYPQEQPVFEFPNDFDFEKQSDYKVVDGALVHDPVPEDVQPEQPTIEERLAAAEGMLLYMLGVSRMGVSL